MVRGICAPILFLFVSASLLFTQGQGAGPALDKYNVRSPPLGAITYYQNGTTVLEDGTVIDQPLPELKQRGGGSNDNCEWAKWFWNYVDCRYSWDGGDFLHYKIDIEATGQHNAGSEWARGVYDNIQGTCGRLPISFTAWYYDLPSVNLHHPQSGVIQAHKALSMTFSYGWPWGEGEDIKGCTRDAILRATCGDDFTFKSSGCYKE